MCCLSEGATVFGGWVSEELESLDAALQASFKNSQGFSDVDDGPGPSFQTDENPANTRGHCRVWGVEWGIVSVDGHKSLANVDQGQRTHHLGSFFGCSTRTKGLMHLAKRTILDHIKFGERSNPMET
eukprot:228868-Rhodomonas_salina.3